MSRPSLVMVIVTLLNTPKKGFSVNSTTNEYNNNKQNIYVA